MAYADEGSGPVVVMVHGNPTWGFYFRTLIAELSPDHRVIVPDHVGMGRSSRPEPGTYDFTLAQRIADFSELMDHVLPDEGPVDLVLHDWGGAIGMGWATANPERIRRLLIMNTAAFPLPSGQTLPWLLRLARSPVGEALIRHAGLFNLATVAIGPRRLLDRSAAVGYLAPYLSAADREAVLAFVSDIPLGPEDVAWKPLMRMSERLHLLKDVPAVVAWGMKDPVFTPALLDEWRTRLPHAQIVRFPNAGHLVLEDAPRPIARIARYLFAA